MRHPNPPFNDFQRSTLETCLTLSENTLNKTPSEKQTHLLIGMDIIKQRVDYDKQSTDDFNKAIQVSLANELNKMEEKLKTELSNKIKTIKEREKVIQEKILKLEERFLIHSKRANTFETRPAENTSIQKEIDRAEKVCASIDKSVEDVKYYFDHKKEYVGGDEYERSVRTNERLQGLLAKNHKNNPVEFLDKLKSSLQQLNSQLVEGEREIKGVSKVHENQGPFKY